MQSRPAAIITALFIAELCATFEGAMLFAALPRLIRDFGDPVTVGWLVTAHLLVAAGASVVAGRLGDIYGRKRVIMLMLILSTIGSVISAMSTSFGPLLFGRAIQGFAGAVLPLSLGVIRESLPSKRIPVAVGLIVSSMSAGAATGLVLGGAIVDNFNWHWMFAASAVMLFVSAVAVQLSVPARPGTPPKTSIDWVEGLLPVPAISVLLLGISLSKQFGWLDTRILALLGLGAVLIVLWVRRSLRSPEPFVDLRLLAHRDVAVANGISVLASVGTMQIVFVFTTLAQAPTWTMAGLGLSATVAGLAKLPSNVLSLTAGPLAGWLAGKRGNRITMVAGCAVATLGWLIALSLPQSLLEMIVLMCIISFGTTMITATAPNTIVAGVPSNRTSEAIGMMTVIRSMFSAIGAQIIAVLLATAAIASPEGTGTFPSAASFRVVMGWIAAVSFVAMLLALLLRRKESDREGIAVKVEGAPV
jgi:MFS family permease